MGQELNEFVKSKSLRAAIYTLMIGGMVNWFLFGFISIHLGGMPEGGYLFGFFANQADEFGILDDKEKVKIVDYATYLRYQTHYGRYFLFNHGEVTEVSKSTYRYVQIHGFISFASVFAFMAFVIWMFYRSVKAGKFRWNFRRKKFIYRE